MLYSGAFGAGKTRALCMKAMVRASKAGAREALCRKHLVTLKATTLRTLLEGDGGEPPVLPLGSYTHHKADKIIRLKRGGEIVYFGLDEPEKIGSYNLSGCGVDEMVETTVDDFRQLQGRIRLKVPGLGNQIYGACNPGPPSHYLAEFFGLALGHKPRTGYHAIQTRTPDNHFLPTDYIADLDKLPGLARKRYFEGLWVGSDGLVYDRWDRTKHVAVIDTKPARVVVGVDDGYTNPFAVLRLHVDGDGRIHAARETYRSGRLLADKIEAIREASHEAEAVVIDPSAADLIAECRASGLHVVEADNAVFDGIVRVQSRLEVCGDGKPRLTVAPECENLMREMETYEWAKNRSGQKDAPVKANDHAADALRYGVAYIDGTAETFIDIVTVAGTPSDERLWKPMRGGMDPTTRTQRNQPLW